MVLSIIEWSFYLFILSAVKGQSQTEKNNFDLDESVSLEKTGEEFMRFMVFATREKFSNCVLVLMYILSIFIFFRRGVLLMTAFRQCMSVAIKFTPLKL